MKQLTSKFMTLFILGIGVIAFLMLIERVYYMPREVKVNEVESCCTIEDKYISIMVAGEPSTVCRQLKITIPGTNIEQTINVSETLYNKAAIGDEIKCLLYYDEDNLIMIDIPEY